MLTLRKPTNKNSGPVAEAAEDVTPDLIGAQRKVMTGRCIEELRCKS
jgi:hypothetical protein